MHDIRAQEVRKFLDGALDGDSKVGVEVGDIGFQSIDVLSDDLNLFHEKGLCKVGQDHRCAQESETRSELGGSGCGGGSIFGDRVGGNSVLNVGSQIWVEFT